MLDGAASDRASVNVTNEGHLRRLLREYVGHYNRARSHRALGLRTPLSGPRLVRLPDGGRVISHSVLGRLHH